MDSIIKKEPTLLANLFKSVGILAERINSAQESNNAIKTGVTNYNFDKYLKAQQLASDLLNQLTINWDFESNKQLLFHSNDTISQLATLSQSARTLIGKLLVALVKDSSITTKELKDLGLNKDFQELQELGSNKFGDLQTITSMTIGNLETLAGKVNSVEAIDLGKIKTSKELFAAAPTLKEVLEQVGRSIAQTADETTNEETLKFENAPPLLNDFGQEVTKLTEKDATGSALATGLVLTNLAFKAMAKNTDLKIKRVGESTQFIINNVVERTLYNNKIQELMRGPTVHRQKIVYNQGQIIGVPQTNYSTNTKTLPNGFGNNRLNNPLRHVLKILRSLPVK